MPETAPYILFKFRTSVLKQNGLAILIMVYIMLRVNRSLSDFSKNGLPYKKMLTVKIYDTYIKMFLCRVFLKEYRNMRSYTVKCFATLSFYLQLTNIKAYEICKI
jgi:hypothetical protein